MSKKKAHVTYSQYAEMISKGKMPIKEGPSTEYTADALCVAFARSMRTIGCGNYKYKGTIYTVQINSLEE